jgi:hypothetical protein
MRTLLTATLLISFVGLAEAKNQKNNDLNAVIIKIENSKDQCTEFRLLDHCDSTCMDKNKATQKIELKEPAFSFMFNYQEFNLQGKGLTLSVDAVSYNHVRLKNLSYVFVPFEYKKFNKISMRMNRWPHHMESRIIKEDAEVTSFCVNSLGHLVNYKAGQ